MPRRARPWGVSMLVAGVAAAICHSGSAHAQSDATIRANRLAYEAAMKCFVANSYASGERSKAGDVAKAAAYNANARRSFDLSYRAGEALGLADAQVARDLDFAQANELPKMVRDVSYLKGVAATCKSLNLM